MKKGFSLMELLVVMVIISVISISSSLVFGNINDDSAETDRMNIYKDMQRAALLYLDLNDSSLSQFRDTSNSGKILISLNNLKNLNYVDLELIDPVTNEEFPSYFIAIYTQKDHMGKDYVNTCILDTVIYLNDGCNKKESIEEFQKCINKDNSNPEKPVACVANSKGEPVNCCKMYG